MSADDVAEPLWTAARVAAFLSVSKSWVYLHAADGTLPSVRIGALRRFDPDVIRAYARGEWVPSSAVLPFPSGGRSGSNRM